MENVTGKIEVERAALEEMERRAVRVNVVLARMKSAVERGDLERFRNLWAEAQEANWTNRKGLKAAGARD